MAKASPEITSFTSGELSPRLEGRVDIPKYFSGSKKLENFVVHPHGGATRRPGTQFISEVKDSSKEHRLIPFEFNVEQTYAVEMGDQTARFITNDGVLSYPEEISRSTDDYPSLGWGSIDHDDGEFTRIEFNPAGTKVYFVKTTEEKTGSTHTLEFAVRQYSLDDPYNLDSASTNYVERTWDFRDCFSSNIADGQRKYHAGMFFANNDLFVWDGIPDIDPDTTGTTHHDGFLYKFDLSNDYDISTTSNGSIESGSVYDARWRIGDLASGTRYPVPIAGIAFNPTFESGILDADRAYGSTSADGSINTSTDFTQMDSVPNRGGAYLVVLVSHLVNASATINDGISGGVGNPVTAEPGALVTVRLNISDAFNPNEIQYWPQGKDSFYDLGVFDEPNTDLKRDASDGPSTFHGLRFLPANNLHLTQDSSGNYVDISGSANIDGHSDHNRMHGVILINYTTESPARVGLAAYGTFIAAADDPRNLSITFSGAYRLSDTTDGDKALHPFMTNDGKRLFYTTGVTDSLTNIVTIEHLQNPFFIFYFSGLVYDDSNSSSYPNWSSETFTYDYADADNALEIQPVEITTPYSSSDLSKVRFAQSADVLYFIHPDHAPRQLIRFGATRWGIKEVDFVRGPMQDPLFDGSTLTASGRTGSVTITASSGLFVPTDVGRLVKLHDGYAEITAFTSETSVTATVLENEEGRTELMPSYTATTISAHEGDPGTTNLEHNDRYQDSAGNFLEQGFKVGMRVSVSGFTTGTNNESSALIVKVTEDTMLIAPSGDLDNEVAGDTVTISGILEADDEYQLGAFSDTTGYPAAVAFYQQRLVFANTLEQPQTLFFSVAGSFEEFTAGSDADDSMTYTIGSSQVNVIEYLAGSRFLVVGTSGGEFVVSSGGLAEPLSPTNTQIRRQANYGSAQVQPVTVANVILFVQRAGRKLRELTYNYDTDSYFAPDMTILSEHITESGIKSLAFQQEPDNIVWCVLKNGELVGMTYRREEEVVGWHAHTLGGTDVVVEDALALPTDLNEDELYLIVKRTIDGSTKRYIEKLTAIDFGSDVKDAWHVDSGLQYDGSATTTITGLDHLEGETVEVLADGFAVSGKTVSSGSITLDTAASKVTVGLPFTSTLQTMRIDAGGTEGTSQGKTKRIRDVTFRFFNTVAADVGPSEQNLDPISFRDSSLAATTATPLFSGDKDITFPSGYDSDGFIVIKQDQALPLTILAIFPRLQTFDR